MNFFEAILSFMTIIGLFAYTSLTSNNISTNTTRTSTNITHTSTNTTRNSTNTTSSTTEESIPGCPLICSEYFKPVCGYNEEKQLIQSFENECVLKNATKCSSPKVYWKLLFKRPCCPEDPNYYVSVDDDCC